MTEILRLIVIITCFSGVSNGIDTVNMVSFGGRADGDYFNGEVMPGAVDTQRYTPAGGTLSARYMLRGVDCEGDSCTIFVENNAVAGQSVTQPRIITDSRALSFLNTTRPEGRIITGDNKLEISILLPTDSVK